MPTRTETDYLGSMQLPADALYGIHSVRAKENFPDTTPFHIERYQAMGLVKQACYLTYADMVQVLREEKLYAEGKGFIPDNIINALITVAGEVHEGKYFDSFIVPAIQGGAGTSINMNVNEIIANSALVRLGYKPGEYRVIDPIEQANIYQSTNDTVPTVLRVAVIRLLTLLEEQINNTRQAVENLEKAHRNSLRIGYTQLQAAVPSSYGQLFSTYSEALSRDWWRVSKCFERIKVVNLGGGAIGTAVGTPRYFVMEVVKHLQQLTGFPFTRSENLNDATANLDSFIDVHAILKAHAVNIEKMASDIRLLASDIAGNPIHIPKRQVGSSIMPGKVNPVIPEFAVSVAHRVYANDMLISNLAGQGVLDLNAYRPTIGYAIIDSIKLLIAANQSLARNLFVGVRIDAEKSASQLMHNPSITTALLPIIGFNRAAMLAQEMRGKKIDIFNANRNLNLIPEDKLKELVKPNNLLKLGFSFREVID
ncbi:MAG TPA: aspartate ammonia-lyase [Bacteroidales bacterium]|mgnify:CR=1 FL=1|nr:aspartate ammonia-lyase [Bacteroidales bacterium]